LGIKARLVTSLGRRLAGRENRFYFEEPGTRLLRERGGRTHTVIVLDDGFAYDGERYRSLTEIARRITGAHWSGPRFFGLRKAAAQPGAKDE
jgi:Protein of unknown function (DUF2924)